MTGNNLPAIATLSIDIGKNSCQMINFGKRGAVKTTHLHWSRNLGQVDVRNLCAL